MTEAAHNSEASKIETIDWGGIIRSSFLFSQGDHGLQQCILKWLAQGPLHGTKISRKDTREAIKQVSAFATALVSNERHFDDIAPPRPEVRLQFNAMINLLAKPEEINQNQILKEILEDLAMGDLTYIESSEGRPVGENSRRDKWSSFIIDFGVLQKGDGFYTWSSLPKQFKLLWKEIIEFAKSAYIEHPDLYEQLKSIKDRYLSLHTALSEDERKKIEEIFPTIPRHTAS